MPQAYKGAVDVYSLPPKPTGQLTAAFNQLLSELDLKGLNPKILDETEKACRALFESVDARADILKLVTPFLDSEPVNHVLLTTFFTAVIAQGSSWAGQRTTENAILASLLHVCGTLALPAAVRSKSFESFTDEEKTTYQTYPILGAQMVRELDLPEPVAQAVLQHRETCNAEGFPYRLTAMKIYPLAKIVSLAADFAFMVRSRELPPLKALMEFVPNRLIVQRHDPEALRSLIKAFVKGGPHA